VIIVINERMQSPCSLAAAENRRLSLTNLRFQVLPSRWASPCTSWVSAPYPKWKWY